MHKNSASLEIFRWGHAHVPGIIFCYAPELEVDMEDIGILCTIFYTFEAKSKPLFQTGVKAGQILQCCPTLTKNKLARKFSKLTKLGIIKVVEADAGNFADRVVFLEPLMEKLEELVIRDHPDFSSLPANDANANIEKQIGEYQQTIEQLELELEEEKSKRITVDTIPGASSDYRKLADFIASKTGNLMSVKMATELKKWLNDMGYQREFLFCLLEMCFERNIDNPRHITKIAQDIKEFSINSVEGLELYFNKYVNSEKNTAIRVAKFDPDIVEFGAFTGIDMSAEARKTVYYKWRYDWAFNHDIIMKAGQIMCQRTKNGGLEYIDSVLNNWMTKEIRTVEEAEKEIATFKSKNKKAPAAANNGRHISSKDKSVDYEIYVPPLGLGRIKETV